MYAIIHLFDLHYGVDTMMSLQFSLCILPLAMLFVIINHVIGSA